MSQRIIETSVLAALETHRDFYVALRRALHTQPEIAYEEHHTAHRVADELASYGLEVHRGIGRTGVVGVLRRGNGMRVIGLRADIDALNITEANAFDYRSAIHGKMHACGHDGHTTMLLLAARYLADAGQFNGTAVFIFQPAEEGGAGGRAMINDGLFERFPVDAVYGLHNIPGIPAGQFAVRDGAMMAAADYFKITLSAPGGHAALPHTTPDPILAGSNLVQTVQALVSRVIDPLEPAVVSVTQFHGGEASNAIPATVVLQGTARTYSRQARTAIETGLVRIANGVAQSYGLQAKVNYVPGYPATINTPREAEFAKQVLIELLGEANVLTHLNPLMTAEDFSYMLQARPGAYLWIGNGDSAGLHTANYDFNDEILITGAAFWVRLA